MENREWQEWPCCGRCGRRRQTICTACGTAGIQFSLAEYLAPVEGLRRSRSTEKSLSDEQGPVNDERGPLDEWFELEILLSCPQCDEAFAPRFYRRCANCGYESSDGIELRRRHIEPLPDRVVFAISCLLLLAVLISLYFWILLHG